MKTAIICYSFTHNNMVLAGDIITRTGGTLISIEEQSSRNRLTIFLDLFFHRVPRIKEYLHLDERFDHHILIAPIWGGKIATPLKAFLMKECSKIRSYSFISVCGGADSQAIKIKNELTGLMKQKPVAVTQLALTELCKEHPAEVISYQLDKEDLHVFEDKIEDFLLTISKELAPIAN